MASDVGVKKEVIANYFHDQISVTGGDERQKLLEDMRRISGYNASEKLTPKVQSAIPNLMLKIDSDSAGDRFPSMKESRFAHADDDDLGAPKGRRNRESSTAVAEAAPAATSSTNEVARVQEVAPQTQAPAQQKEFDVIRI